MGMWAPKDQVSGVNPEVVITVSVTLEDLLKPPGCQFLIPEMILILKLESKVSARER